MKWNEKSREIYLKLFTNKRNLDKIDFFQWNSIDSISVGGKKLNHYKKSQLFKFYALNSSIRCRIYWILRPMVQCRVSQWKKSFQPLQTVIFRFLCIFVLVLRWFQIIEIFISVFIMLTRGANDLHHCYFDSLINSIVFSKMIIYLVLSILKFFPLFFFLFPKIDLSKTKKKN